MRSSMASRKRVSKSFWSPPRTRPRTGIRRRPSSARARDAGQRARRGRGKREGRHLRLFRREASRLLLGGPRRRAGVADGDGAQGRGSEKGNPGNGAARFPRRGRLGKSLRAGPRKRSSRVVVVPFHGKLKTGTLGSTEGSEGPGRRVPRSVHHALSAAPGGRRAAADASAAFSLA